MRRNAESGAIILPTLLLLSGIAFAASLSFSFFSTSGIQSVARGLKSAEAFAAAESGISDSIAQILSLFSDLSSEGENALAILYMELNMISSYEFVSQYDGGREIVTQVEICYVIDSEDTCGGSLEKGKIRSVATGISDGRYRRLEGIFSVDALTWKITVDSIQEVSVVGVGADVISLAEFSFSNNSSDGGSCEATWSDTEICVKVPSGGSLSNIIVTSDEFESNTFSP